MGADHVYRSLLLSRLALRNSRFFIFPMLQTIRLTPPGRGAVAVLRLSGPNALEVLARRFQRSAPLVENRPIFGRFRLSNTTHDEEVVVHVLGPDAVEICSHGGEAVVAAIERTLIEEGTTSISWQDFFFPGDSQRDRASRLLPFAKTERTAQILLDQILLDLPVPPPGDECLGKHLVEPFRVVLAGASNVGKSSLLNAILGFKRSFVHPTAGTTRDMVGGQTALEGFPVTFFDSAGFRKTDDDLERQGIDRSRLSLSDADLVVWVLDLTVEESQRPPCPAEENVMFCCNKIDLVGTPAHSDSAVAVSALTGEGIETLLDAVIRRLVPQPPKPGEAVFVRFSTPPSA